MTGWSDEIAMAVAAGEGLLLLGLFIWIAVLTGKLRKLRRAHDKMIGDTGVPELENVLHQIHEQLAGLERDKNRHAAALKQLEHRLAAMKGNVGVHRFNAFSDTGSDLSFSVAFVNDAQDGVVITGIHGREQTFLYAKPIDKGQSAYMLSPEEKTAINLALQKE
jgi:hypothetical protein